MSLSLLLILSLFTPLSSPFTPPHRFIKSISPSHRNHTSQEYVEVTRPPPSDQLTPSCSPLFLHRNFGGNTVDLPPVSVPYSPPSDCPPPWPHVVLEFLASSKGEQHDRIAGVWLGGAEILRTSTAVPPTKDGIFWKVRKDVTRYSSLLVQSNLTLTVMLETNAVDNVHTGGYQVNVSLLYYNHSGVRVPLSGAAKSSVIVYREAIDSVNRQKPKNSLNLYESPADLIIPISGIRNKGFWFRIESVSDVHSKGIQIPRNTQKAVLEVYVSFHGNDEFWYSNPPDSYLRMNNLTTERGHGAYREVFVTIDDNLVGSVVPFPVIFTGGFNRLFWQPVVAIGAFNLPSYDFDVTPFLGLLLDRKIHIFGLGVIDSIPFWLVDANLHLWLDHGSSAVEAKTVEPHFPAVSIQRRSSFKLLNGSFKIVAKRKNQFMGWVRSSGCNLTTHVSYEFKFRSSVKFKENGTYKSVVQTVKTKTQVKVVSEIGSLVNRASVKGNYPLTIVSSTLPGSKKNTYLIATNVSHSVREKSSNGYFSCSVYNIQDSRGWMKVKRDQSVLSGGANTNQSYSYKDEFGCYSRTVVAFNGTLFEDSSTFLCPSSF